jgi:hypothetical protein
MADYKVPNLCGASDPFNALQSKFDDMINTAASPAGLIADAAALATSLSPTVTSLLEEVESMLPELPTLPDVNLQAELTSLSGLTAGSFEHGTLLAEITTKFGTALAAGGFSIDTLVDTALDAVLGAGDVDICGGIPNFTIPAAGGTAIEKAVGIKQADVNSLVEEASTLLANVNFTAAKTAVEETFTSYEEIGEEVPDESIGPYRVAEETTGIVTSDNKGNITTLELTTAMNAAAAAFRSNVSAKGFSRRVIWKNGVKSFDNYDPNFAGDT